MSLLCGGGQAHLALAIAPLCLCVLMQLLGVPATLWDLNFEDDLMETPISECMVAMSRTSVLQPCFHPSADFANSRFPRAYGEPGLAGEGRRCQQPASNSYIFPTY